MGNVISVVPFIAGPLLTGVGIGLSMRDEVKEWYPTIKKPSWTPPPWLFGPAWTVLYTCMGVASWRVWRAGGGPIPLGLYAAQLALNFAWSPLFFKRHALGAAAVDITVLLGVLVTTILEFKAVDATAAALMVPYLGWTCFATALVSLDLLRALL